MAQISSHRRLTSVPAAAGGPLTVESEVMPVRTEILVVSNRQILSVDGWARPSRRAHPAPSHNLFAMIFEG